MNEQRRRDEELCLPGDAIPAANKQKGGGCRRSREGLGLSLGLGFVLLRKGPPYPPNLLCGPRNITYTYAFPCHLPNDTPNPTTHTLAQICNGSACTISSALNWNADCRFPGIPLLSSTRVQAHACARVCLQRFFRKHAIIKGSMETLCVCVCVSKGTLESMLL